VCLKSISPQQVLEKAYEMLEKKKSGLFSHAIVDFD
jgi:hypothetical protein